MSCVLNELCMKIIFSPTPNKYTKGHLVTYVTWNPTLSIEKVL